jgi:hypothetical protein
MSPINQLRAMANASQVMEFVARTEIIVIQGGSAGHKIAIVASLAMLFCGIGCMPPGSACCDSYGNYCGAGDQCIVISNGASKCCPATETCDGQVAVTTFAAGTTITGAVPSTTIPSTILPSSSASATSLLSTSIVTTTL